jgi:hypothetical protein
MRINLTIRLIPLILIMSCSSSSCGYTQDVKTVAVDTFKCAVKYPADVINQTAALVKKIQGSEGFVANIIAWAEEAKDSQFAMCVMTTVVADIAAATATVATTPAAHTIRTMAMPVDELTPAVENFRRKHFGNLKFEIPDQRQ